MLERTMKNQNPWILMQKWNPKSMQKNGKLVGGKQKLQTHKEATQTPLPGSQECQNKTPRAPTTMPSTMETTKGEQTSSTNDKGNGNKTETETENNWVKGNNGTLRITVRWRPTKNKELLADKTLWNYEATDLVHFILGTAAWAAIYSWKTAPGAAPAIPSITLTPDHLLAYIGQQTLPTSPTKAFIFSFRLCLTASRSKRVAKKSWYNTKFVAPSCGTQPLKRI